MARSEEARNWAEFFMDNLWKIALLIVGILVAIGILDFHLVKAGGDTVVEWIKALRG